MNDENLNEDLTGTPETEEEPVTEETTVEETTENTEATEDLTGEDNPVVEEQLGDTVETTEIVVVSEDRPFLTTPLDEYTVTEGLLLMLLLCVVVKLLVSALKGGFSWLR